MIPEFLKEHFFLITKDNYLNCKSKVYGYALTNRSLYYNYANIESELTDIDDSSAGAYVYVQDSHDKITIKQDMIGCYGLFFYKTDDFWAISNSFYYLFESLHGRKLTSNFEYSCYFLCENFASFIDSETIFKDIVMLDGCCDIVINKKQGNVEILPKKNLIHSVSLDSIQGIDTIDQWICKWRNVISILIKNGRHISVDISGGFDSRIVLSLFYPFFKSGSIEFKSDTTRKSDDLKIAKIISLYFDIPLNEKIWKQNSYRISPEDSFLMHLYTSMGFHKRKIGNGFYNLDTDFKFGGRGGEYIRGRWDISCDDFLEKFMFLGRRSNSFIADYAVPSFIRSVRRLQRDNESSLNELYRKGRCRHHFGREGIVKTFLHNHISFAPLLDPLLIKLDASCGATADPLVIYPLIILRACPQLLDLPFENRRAFPDDVIKNAKKLNMLKRNTSFINDEFNFLCQPSKGPSEYSGRADPMQYATDLFKSKFVTSIYEYMYSCDFIDYKIKENSEIGEDKIISIEFSLLPCVIMIFNELKNKFDLPYKDIFDPSIDPEVIKNCLNKMEGADSFSLYEHMIEKAAENCKLAPEITSVRLRYATLLKDKTASLELLTQLYEENPDNEYVCSALGLQYMRSKSYEKAVSVFRKLVHLNPREVNVIYLIRALRATAHYTEAMAVAQELLVPPIGKYANIELEYLKQEIEKNG